MNTPAPVIKQSYGSLNDIIGTAIRTNWNLDALTDMGGATLQYKEVAENIAKLHILFKAAGLRHDGSDKVALIGRNTSNWAVTFIACLTYGVVAVPVLHEFTPETLTNIINHSDSALLFVDEAIWRKLDAEQMPSLQAVLYIAEYGMPFCRNNSLRQTREHLNERFGEQYPADFKPDSFTWQPDTDPEQIALISYTSGSTGMSKGVMLPYRSIWSNIRFCIDDLTFLKPGDGIVNMLPLAHLYGMIIEMLHPFVKGCHCYFLSKAPSPRVLLSAFAQVRPKLVITVPLVLEKIVRTQVFPQLEKPMMRLLLTLPLVRNRVLRKIHDKLIDIFGGQLQEVIIGGAAMGADVEQFLKRIDFPFTIGYGMTECGPLITYEPPQTVKFHSVGKVMDRMQIRIDSPDPEHKPGNLWVRGANVMKGYYKNPEATAEVIPNPEDGWMNTGDMCLLDSDGFVTICGRSKAMILGPSGQNIYPEEIEVRLNALPYVTESLVIDDGGKLVALIVPDQDAADRAGLGAEGLQRQMDENLKALNRDMPSYSRVTSFRLRQEPFEKTPKQSIKRFLYTK